MSSKPTLCVAGASGLVGSHIIRAALLAGYGVNGTLRDAGDPTKAPYLRALPHGEERLRLFSADMFEEGAFDAATEGTDGVFIMCSPYL